MLYSLSHALFISLGDSGLLKTGRWKYDVNHSCKERGAGKTVLHSAGGYNAHGSTGRREGTLLWSTRLATSLTYALLAQMIMVGDDQELLKGRARP